MQTVLATFDDSKSAQGAVEQLIAQGFPRTSVHLQTASAITGSIDAPSPGVMASVGHFFDTLFGADDKSHAGRYAEAVRRGSTVVVVDANTEADVHKAQTVMEKFGTVSSDPGSTPYLAQGLAPDGDTVSVLQENWVVGKRTVDVGGLRVIKRVSATPVSQTINLRQEKVTIQRRPIDRPATEEDFQSFKEGTFEVRETAEEAVVSKEARVVEEVSIGRHVTNHSETVTDTVRRTDVEVERIPSAARPASVYTK